ncbi:DDE-type integrase/transposase/recombinase [Alicyclobacillus fodiniaquatilis]|uniref:DDE-type integrase/transposase/recombinase n=1 Tax=Alicyclobacillus fodiniaquatilis TaxID=1661150 RepID=A0ABW4JAU7_9BACL
MKDSRKAEEIAANRVQMLSPLLVEGLDAGRARQIRAEICAQTGLSERTIRRYLAQYRKESFEGLKPRTKVYQRPEAIPESLLEQAILLRREVPTRSISQIIQILEWEGHIKQGQIKRSTLQEKLAERGYSSRQMRMYAATGTAARRFQRRHRNELWQSDIKFGPYLPIGPGGAKKQVYLVVFIDDASRYVLHAEFYPTLDQTIVEDCFRQAIQKYGTPDATYFDNGKQYRTRWMARTCSKLGIRLLYTRPYAAESKGKVEKFNRTIDSFLNEVALDKPQTLEELNQKFAVWLSECYQNRPHTALSMDAQSISPETAFRSDRKALRFVGPEVLADAFLHAETRKVDKSGCISFMDCKYEVGLSFIGCTVDVLYDPADISQVTIEYKGHESWQAHPLVIGERAGKRPNLPDHLGPQQADSSRLLDAAQKQHEQCKEHQARAISYTSAWDEVKRDV